MMSDSCEQRPACQCLWFNSGSIQNQRDLTNAAKKM
jgi:hypothetical protein